MALQEIEYGSLASSEVVNDNFEYLDGRITTVGSSITTLQSNIQSLNTTLNNTINTAVSNINASLGHLPYSSYIDGLIITKSTTNTIAVTNGSCYDSGGDIVLKLTTSTTKQNESQAASAMYYVYIIGDNDGSTIDILISSSSSSPTMPTGYTKYRLIGGYTTNSNSEIDTVSYYGESATSDKSANGILDVTAPDWVNMVDRSATTTYTATTAGYVYGYITRLRESKTCTITINSQYSFSSYMPIGAVGGYWNSCNLLIPVGKGDTYYMDNNGASYVFKFIPVKGGN